MKDDNPNTQPTPKTVANAAPSQSDTAHTPHRPVRALSEETARKIAAGEVIDRPASIVRELIDNAIDSGGTDIRCEITGGGIDSVRVSDNGCGMTKDDLEHCAYPHATSKIERETDLLSLSTLGFRGEALVSIAAVSRLSVSSVRAGGIAYELTVSDCDKRSIKPISRRCGTAVESSLLFENIPARRVFLKKSATESKLCRQTFTEKALAHPALAFTFVQDGKTKLEFPKNQTLASRFVSALELRENASLFHETKTDCSADGFSFSLVLGDCAVRRSDKKNIYIFINGRRIWEYALVQAIEYGSQGYFPNGTYPVASLYLTVDPKLVDFNIHPAKREVRFRDIAPIHRAVSGAVRSFYKASAVASLAEAAQTAGLGSVRGAGGAYGDGFVGGADGGGESANRNNESAALFETTGDAGSAWGGANITEGDSNSADYGADGDSGYGADYGADGGTSLGARTVTQRFSPDTFRDTKRTFASAPTHSYRAHVAQSAYGGEPKSAPSDEAFGYGERIFSQSFLPHAPHESATGFGDTDTRFGTETKNTADWAADSASVRYLGTALGVFLIAQRGDALYLIDQHAAHERILYNRFMSEKSRTQALLFPYIIETQSESDDEYLKNMANALEEAGFTLNALSDGTWEVTSVPALYHGTEEDLAADLLQKRVTPCELTAHIAATSACRAAVKDGTILDDETAKTLVMQALNLPDPHCPHGRPVLVTVTKDELFSLVRRTE